MNNIKNWPIYFKERLIVENLNSNTGVVTLWTPKEVVAQELDRNSFSVCGQLYTKRGITPLLRNVLANPKIRYIVLSGIDRQGSGEALINFFEKGVETRDSNKKTTSHGWDIVGDNETSIDKEIPLEALENLRKNVEAIDMREKPLKNVAKKVSSLEPKKAFDEPQIFPEPKISQMQRYPSDLSVFKIRRSTISNAWVDALKTINKFGATIPGMYGQVREIHNLSIVVEDEDPNKPLIPAFMTFRKTGLAKYIKGFFEKEKGNEDYAYGERIFNWDGIDQEKIMVEKLNRYKYDRGALAVLWKPHKDNFPPPKTKVKEMGQTKGWTVPCLVMILGHCLDDKFFMTAIFRNNDIFGAWPLNAFALRTLQYKIAKKIKMDLGALTTISHIAEIYEIDWETSAKIVKENDGLERTCVYDQRSNYTVEVKRSNIVVKFFTPDGFRQIGEYTKNGKGAKAARDLCAEINRDMLISELGAAADLGRQLAKAETAIKLGLRFEQDQPLK
ncbi:hypothetical protein JXA34_01600 [Patescibacteria group bacterium]|nr:hypothetical protein [Patescibacteria group bacterium]